MQRTPDMTSSSICAPQRANVSELSHEVQDSGAKSSSTSSHTPIVSDGGREPAHPDAKLSSQTWVISAAPLPAPDADGKTLEKQQDVASTLRETVTGLTAVPKDDPDIGFRHHTEEGKRVKEAMPSLGFIILTHCRNQIHLDNLLECVQSVRKFHAGDPIAILDDGSTVDVMPILKDANIANMQYAQTRVKHSAEIGLWDFYHAHKFCEKAVFLQDTMHLCGALTGLDCFAFRFIWNNAAHRASTSVVSEPQTPFNVQNQIATHDDLARYMVHQFLPDKDFQKYFDSTLPDVNKWLPGWASLAIVSHDFLVEFERKTRFLNLVPFINDRRRRSATEIIIGILIQWYGGAELVTSYDGFIWDHRTDTGWKSSKFWRKQHIAVRFCPCDGCKNQNGHKCC